MRPAPARRRSHDGPASLARQDARRPGAGHSARRPEAAAAVALGAEQLTAAVGEGIGTSANELGAALDPPADLAGPYFPDGPMPYVADDQIPSAPDDQIPYDPEGAILYVPDGPVPDDLLPLDPPGHIVS